MYEIDKMPSVIDIGYIGEKNFRTIEIDMTAWMLLMPDGIPSIVHIRPEDGNDDAYIADTTFEDNILTWVITAGDLGSVDGVGTMQVWLEEEENDSVDKRGKSVLVTTRIHESLGEPSSVVPAAQTAWLEALTALKVATVDAKGAAETAQGKAEDAQEAAETAQGKAEDAQDAAETAQGKAEDAQDAAEDAQEAAEAAQSAAEDARDKYPDIDSATEKWKLWNPSAGEYEVTDHPSRGAQGNPGVSSYMHIKWSASQPTQDSDMKNTVDAWIGVYTGTSSTAPTHYTDYTWYKYKGETGATGPGVPNGGTTGQILTKNSDTDQDTKWAAAPDPNGKADKVQNATNGDLAGLDSSGNLTDSGKKTSDFVASNQGSGNAGKALGIANDGTVTPVPFSGTDFTGATALAAGTHGYVPAPAAGQQTYFLCGDGSWAIPPNGKLIVRELDAVTNVSGSYTHTTTVSDVTADMKPVMIELSDPTAFGAKITVTPSDGSITLTCSEVAGTSTVKVGLMFVASASAITSSEFDVLAARIGTLSNLTTTAKSDLVSAINELDGDIGTLNSNITDKFDKANVYNGLDKTASGFALDARKGKELNDSKLKGTHGLGNDKLELRNDANNATFISHAKSPSTSSPSVWLDVNPTSKIITVYKNIGSGWVSCGTININ